MLGFAGRRGAPRSNETVQRTEHGPLDRKEIEWQNSASTAASSAERKLEIVLAGDEDRPLGEAGLPRARDLGDPLLPLARQVPSAIQEALAGTGERLGRGQAAQAGQRARARIRAVHLELGWRGCAAPAQARQGRPPQAGPAGDASAPPHPARRREPSTNAPRQLCDRMDAHNTQVGADRERRRQRVATLRERTTSGQCAFSCGGRVRWARRRLLTPPTLRGEDHGRSNSCAGLYAP